MIYAIGFVQSVSTTEAANAELLPRYVSKGRSSDRNKPLAHRCTREFQPRVATERIVVTSKPAAAKYSYPSIAIDRLGSSACFRRIDFVSRSKQANAVIGADDCTLPDR